MYVDLAIKFLIFAFLYFYNLLNSLCLLVYINNMSVSELFLLIKRNKWYKTLILITWFSSCVLLNHNALLPLRSRPISMYNLWKLHISTYVITDCNALIFSNPSLLELQSLNLTSQYRNFVLQAKNKSKHQNLAFSNDTNICVIYFGYKSMT